MSNDTTTEAENLNMPPPRSVNICNVPYEVWQHVRINAIRSELSFQEYCILLLMDGQVYPPHKTD